MLIINAPTFVLLLEFLSLTCKARVVSGIRPIFFFSPAVATVLPSPEVETFITCDHGVVMLSVERG